MWFGSVEIGGGLPLGKPLLFDLLGIVAKLPLLGLLGGRIVHFSHGGCSKKIFLCYWIMPNQTMLLIIIKIDGRRDVARYVSRCSFATPPQMRPVACG